MNTQTTPILDPPATSEEIALAAKIAGRHQQHSGGVYVALPPWVLNALVETIRRSGKLMVVEDLAIQLSGLDLDLVAMAEQLGMPPQYGHQMEPWYHGTVKALGLMRQRQTLIDRITATGKAPPDHITHRFCRLRTMTTLVLDAVHSLGYLGTPITDEQLADLKAKLDAHPVTEQLAQILAEGIQVHAVEIVIKGEEEQEADHGTKH